MPGSAHMNSTAVDEPGVSAPWKIGRGHIETASELTEIHSSKVRPFLALRGFMLLLLASGEMSGVPQGMPHGFDGVAGVVEESLGG